MPGSDIGNIENDIGPLPEQGGHEERRRPRRRWLTLVPDRCRSGVLLIDVAVRRSCAPSVQGLARNLYRTVGRRRETVSRMRSYRQYCPSLGRPRSWPSAGRRLWSATCSMAVTASPRSPGVCRPCRDHSLIKRLKELERSGVVVKTADGTYQLADAGADLAMIDGAGGLGRTLAGGHNRAVRSRVRGWAWSKYHLDPENLPERCVLVESRFDEPPTNRRYWLLAERRPQRCAIPSGRRTGCVHHRPLGGVTRWHLGMLDWRRALADGSITVTGTASLRRAVPTWNRHPDPLPLVMRR